ncbi:MAG: deoxyuridine 5-triphosphate nucleotidohydrolase [Pseudobdellovibrio sp.]|nr:deoxyuridine 5-triphosphate nucleotidohydrolase [Pseudobdellovibrio sp.]
MNVKVKTWAHFKGELPAYQSPGASGFDVRAQLEGKSVILKKGERALVPTGLSFEIPVGYEIQARPRSGWAAKQGLTVLNTPGTIDADYRGEVKVILVNLGQEDVVIQDQDRCAQFVIAPIYQAKFELVEALGETERGAGGFGSTGKQ